MKFVRNLFSQSDLPLRILWVALSLASLRSVLIFALGNSGHPPTTGMAHNKGHHMSPLRIIRHLSAVAGSDAPLLRCAGG